MQQMKSMPEMPAGWVSQPFIHVDAGERCFESHRVYDAESHLVEGRSFWLITPLDHGDEPEMAVLTYDEYLATGGRLPYREFETESGLARIWQVPPRQIT
jgi:hypothetical protein